MKIQNEPDGLLPIHNAARDGDWDAVHAELSAGVDVDVRAQAPAHDKVLSHEGATALHLAAIGGQGEICARLIGRGAEVDARTIEGRTPLHYATWLACHPTVVGTLLGEGADPNARTWDGTPPLHLAARAGEYRSVVLLLRRGADPSAATERGGTALHMAAINGHLAVATRLKDAGTPLDAVDQLGRTAADWAREQGHADVERVLRLP